jgi:hypothetical protein
MNPPTLPWVSVDSVESFFSWFFATLKNIWLFFTGTGDPLFTAFTVSVYWLDVLLVVGVCAFAVWYFYLKNQLDELEEKRVAAVEARYLKPAPVEVKHSRWDTVTLLIRSSNENDWKQAIIDCDSMLDELLIQLGYPGETLGERLKSCSRAQFPDLDAAWSAHKVRNQIAHPTAGWKLDQRTALTTYYLYERIFKKSGFIV